MATPSDPLNTTGTELEVLKNLENMFRQKNPNVGKYTKEAIDWFRKYIPRSYNEVKTSVMFRDRSLWKTQMQLGKLYFFEYDALHKAKLPWFDRYPLAFPFSQYKAKDGMTIVCSLNMHYLSPQHRMLAYITLLKFRNESRYRKSTKLQLDWQILKTLSDSKYFKHCVHSYRMDQVRSVFVEIPAQSWATSLFLPVARFNKGTNSEIWKLK